jgi:tRNA A37 threonylcarbamoyladenosine synthetase subunit TsaC/SUA5/YrdC
MVTALGRPILTTSAGPSGEDALIDAKEIDEMFRGLALVLDGGAGGLLPTSVIDLTVDPPVVVRAGVGPVDEFGGDDQVPNSLRGPYSKR